MSTTTTPAAFVTLRKAEELTGYTVKAMERKIERGEWLEGEVWKKAPDGRRLIIVKGYEAWAARAPASK